MNLPQIMYWPMTTNRMPQSMKKAGAGCALEDSQSPVTPASLRFSGMPQIDQASFEAIQPELTSGESILWAAQPNTSGIFHREDLYLIPFSLLWGGFALSEGIQSGASTLFCLATECGSRIIPLIMTMVDPEEERQRLTKFYAEMSEGGLQQIFDDADSLTEVAGQVLQSEMERRGLDTTPSETGTDVAEHRELVTIGKYRDLPEALLAKGSLDSAGIECFLSDENIVRMDWFLSNLLGGVKLNVKPEDADAALEILAQPAPDGFDVEGVGQYERHHCPECNSMEISFEELNKPVAFTSASLGVPIPLHRDGWKCHSCGHKWQEDVDV
jgi:hypothetical protein